MSLTDKQRAFVDEYMVNGFNQTKAYLFVYPDSEEESARRSASRLLTNVDVIAYLEQEREALNKRKRLGKVEKLFITENIITAEDSERTLDRLKAIEIHNKMLGHNEPDKVEHSGSGFNLTIEVPEEDK